MNAMSSTEEGGGLPQGSSPAAPPVDTRMGGWTGVGYDDVEPGRQWPPANVVVTLAMLARFHRCIGAPPPDAGTPLPAFLLNELRVLKSHLQLPPGILHAHEELHLHSPAYPDEPLTIAVSIHDKYVKRGKRFVRVAQRVAHADSGEPVLDVLHTLYWPC